MTDLPLNDPKGEGVKTPAGTIIAFLALLGAGLGGLAAFTDNVGKIGADLHEGCQSVGFCDREPLKAPVLASYNSPEMAGGSNPTQQCGPKREAYARQYPQFNIIMQTSESHDKDIFGHVTYRYHCDYAATAK